MTRSISHRGFGAAPATSLLKLATLPVAALQTMAMARPTAPPADPLQIVPDECRYLEPYAPPTNGVPTNTPAVMATPFVKGSESQVASLLAAILGPSGNAYVGGPALVSAIARMSGTSATTEAQLLPATPTFVTAGWMPDSENDQDVSQGTLWIAFKFREPKSTSWVQRFGMDVLRSAGAEAGFGIGGTRGIAAPRMDAGLVAVALARSTADPDLQAAAIQSVRGLTSVAAVFRLLLGNLGDITRNARRTLNDVKASAATLQRAVQVMMGIEQTAQQVEAAVSTALQATPEQALAQQTVLASLMSALGQMESDLRQASQMAPAVRSDFEVQRDAIVQGLRDEVVSQANRLSTSPIGLAREIARCTYLGIADRQFVGFRDEARTALTDAKGAADFLVANAEVVVTVLAQLAALRDRVQYALDQLPLSPLMRDYFGVPGWGWLLGGGVTLVGGAVGIRAIRKRRAPKPNRRRVRRRTSR